jgi:hypothetical protein
MMPRCSDAGDWTICAPWQLHEEIRSRPRRHVPHLSVAHPPSQPLGSSDGLLPHAVVRRCVRLPSSDVHRAQRLGGLRGTNDLSRDRMEHG